MERVAQSMGGGTRSFAYNESSCLDAEYFKVVADGLVRNQINIQPLLHTYVVETICERDANGRKSITGALCESKSGRFAIYAKRVIDCTGDADVAFLAGAKCVKYDRRDMMGVTTVFNVAGVDKAKFLQYVENNPRRYVDWSKGDWKQYTTGKENELKTPYLDTEFEKADAKGVISLKTADEHGVSFNGTWSSLSEAGEATNLNLVHLRRVDGTNVLDLTKAEMEGRRQTLNAIEALKSTLPGFENTKLRNFCMQVGIRDTRKIVGRHSLSDQDVRQQGRFKDSIGIYPEFIDGYNVLIIPTTGRYFQVPYGVCVSPDVDNLLVAGRCVSGDRTSHAAMRNMSACCVTGQGCGVAAAVSILKGSTTGDVDIALVQTELIKQGVRVE